MHKDYLIGSSGYYYPYWKNKFYPAGLAPKNWLAYYSTVFNSVELNGTFYRTPKLADLQKYAGVTPPEFKFSVKMSKYITHILKMKGSKQSVADFQELLSEGLGDKISCFLFQLPPSFYFSEENLELVLANVPPRPDTVVEFRHLSWWNEVVDLAFRKAGITFCNVDFPGLDTYIIQTSSLFYLRLHGKPQLFKSAYSDNQLQRFYKQLPSDCVQYHTYFNNTFYEAGYENAQQFMKIVQKQAV